MVMRERLYKDAHPLHKVSKKNFYFIFLRENSLAKNGKKIKKRKKFRAKRKGESGAEAGRLRQLFFSFLKAKKCPYGSYPAGGSL